MLFDIELRHGICAIHLIPCACDECKYMLDKPWVHGLTQKQQPHYQHIIDCFYWKVLGSFNKLNIITFSQKATTSEAFEDIHQGVLDGIIENMISLVQYGKYGAMNTTYTSTTGYYVIKFVSEAYNLQDDTTCDGKNISAGKLVVKAQYLSCMQENTNSY